MADAIAVRRPDSAGLFLVQMAKRVGDAGRLYPFNALVIGKAER